MKIDDIGHLGEPSPVGPKVHRGHHGHAWDCPRDALELTWRSTGPRWATSRRPSVLHVLRDTIAKRPPSRAHPVLMMAMGPGVLLRARAACGWQ